MIEKAQLARVEKHLSALINTSAYGVVTNKQYVENLIADGGIPDCFDDYSEKLTIARDEKLAYLRQNVPHGNPNHPETKKYMVLKNEVAQNPRVTVLKYAIKTPYTTHTGTVSFMYSIVSKMMYDYALRRTESSNES